MITLASKLPARAARAGLTAAIVLLGSASFTAAHAADPTIVVHFGDLNLASDAGAAALYHRIVAAAAQVCPAWDPNNLATISIGAACRKAAIERAVAAIPSQKLAAIHAAHDKRA